MALTIVDRRTIYDQADSTTGWTPGSFGTTTTDIAEASAAVAESLATTTGQAYFTGSSIDLSDTLVYVWLFNNALQGSWTTGATSLLLGDGTDRIAFHMAGGDRKVFTHLDGPVSWQAAVLDGSLAGAKDSAGETTVVAGSFAALNMAAITDVGGHFITGSKALGGGYNVAVDILRYGNDGIRIIDGGVSTQGTFLELAAADRSTTDQDGHGVFRELQPVAFGCQAPLTFGDSGAATDCYFEDSGFVVVYEDWDVDDDKYYFNVEGHASATNLFILSDATITSAGPFVSMDFSAGEVDTLTLTGVIFSALGNGILFSNSADATGHDVTFCTFNGCGQIDPGDVTFTDNAIQATTAGATGAMLLDADGTTNWSDLVFTSGGTGHAIYITAAGSYTFTGFSWVGYGGTRGSNLTPATGSTDAMVYNFSGGLVTITVAGGGESPSCRNGAGATTAVIAGAVTVQVTVVTAAGVPIENANVFLPASSGAGGFPFEESVTIVNAHPTATVTHTAHGMATGDFTHIKGASHWENNGSFDITVTTVNAYTYTTPSDPGSNPTGSITSTFVALNELTNASGIATVDREYSTDQPVAGWARLSTSPPRFKQGPITGTVDTMDGFTGTAVLVLDE